MSSAAADQPPVPAGPAVPLRASREEGLTETEQFEGYNVHDAFQLNATGNPIINPDFQCTPPRPTAPQYDEASPKPDVQTATLDNTPPMLGFNEQSSILQGWMDAIPQIASQRELILTERTDVKRVKTLLHQQEEYFVKVIEEFFSLRDVTTQEGLSSQRQEELNDLSKRLEASRQTLESLRKGRSELEDRLSSHEYILTKLEQRAYHDIDSQRRLGLLQETTHTLRPSDTIENLSEDRDAPQTLRDKLYSRMADLRILLDRLHDFEDYLRHELDDRDVLRATGQTLPSNDAQFFDDARIERAKLQSEYEEAQADVERLKQLCIRQGVEFQDVQFHDPFQQETFYDDTYSALSTQEEAATLALPESPPSILGTFFATRERVKNWLRDPSSSDTLLTGGIERQSEYRERRESRSDAGWVVPRERDSWPRRGRPPSLSSAGDEAQYGKPMQISGAPLDSQRLEALLKDSVDEPTETIRKHRGLSNTTV